MLLPVGVWKPSDDSVSLREGLERGIVDVVARGDEGVREVMTGSAEDVELLLMNGLLEGTGGTVGASEMSEGMSAVA